MDRRMSDFQTNYDSDNNFNSVFDRGPLNDRMEDKRRSIFGSLNFECYNAMSRASSTESLLEDLSIRANTLFHTLDPHQRGFINKEDLFSLNCDLNEDDLLEVFTQLDQDKDGCINANDFKAGLKLINKQIHKKNLEKRRSRVNSLSGWSPPQEFDKPSTSLVSRSRTVPKMPSSDEGMSLISCEEKVCDFYEAISLMNPDLAEQFNDIIEIILNDTKELSKEKQVLVSRFHREKLIYEGNLRHLEEEYESQIELIYQKEIKSEVDKKEKEYKQILQKKNEELSQLKEKLYEAEESFRKMVSSVESSQVTLEKKDQLLQLQRENNNFQVQLSASQSECTMLRSELVTSKQQYQDRISQLQQENNSLRMYEKDWLHLSNQLKILREINRKLQDTNDSLRSAIERSPSASEIIHRISCTSPPPSYNAESKLVQCDPAYVKPQNIILGRDKIDSATHDSLLDEHVIDELLGDSGLSTLRDVTELESEIEPVKLCPEILISQKKSNSFLKPFLSAEDILNDCQTQSLDQTMVSRPNSLHTEKTRSRRSSKDSSIHQRSDVGELSASSLKGSINKQRSKDKRKNQSRYRDRLPKGDASDSEYPLERWESNNNLRNVHQANPKLFQCMPERVYKIVFAGDASVGKSTFIMRLCTNSFVSDCMATIGIDFRNKTIEVDGKYIGLQLWDTAGQERFRSMTANYFRKADGVLLLYDCTYADSFIHVRDWVETIRSAAGEEIPIVLVANKSDLRDRYIEEGRKIVSKELGVNLAKDNKLIFVETSAKSGENIQGTIEELARVLTKNEDLQVLNTSIDLAKANKANEKLSKASSSCCK